MADATARPGGATSARTPSRTRCARELAAGTLAEAFAATAAERAGRAGARGRRRRRSRTASSTPARRASAGFLRERGVDAGDRVLLCAPTSMELVVAYLGVLRVGATAMPCDAALTAAELGHLLDDGEPVAAFVAPDARERLDGPARVATVVAIGGATTASTALDGDPAAPEPRPGARDAGLHLGHDRRAEGRAAHPRQRPRLDPRRRCWRGAGARTTSSSTRCRSRTSTG